MPLYKNRREKVFVRDNYTCQAHKLGLPYCGSHKNLTVHELLPKGTPHRKCVKHRLTVCFTCHTEINKREATGPKLQLIERL